MNNKLAINLGWSSNYNIENDYYKWLDICKKNEIKFVRIFLCSWSINALYDNTYLKILENIINYADNNDIEICLVLNNFVDYNIKNYSDINDIKYSWKANPYYTKYKKVKKFFQVIDQNYLNDVKSILDIVEKYSNIKYIEIMNEIDQINCFNNILINWVNNLIAKLERIYKNRYTFTCSISNHELFKIFKKQINCYVDLHFYSFPYESAIENIEYMNNKNKILYLGEYAKFSDRSYLQDMESKIYFSAGLWGSYFYNLEYVPLHWWWQDLLIDGDYLKIISNYKSISQKLGVVTSVEKIDIEYKIVNKTGNLLEKKKFNERFKTLLKHPLFIVNELHSIKKFINKKRIKQSEVVFRKINTNKKEIFYLECRNDIIVSNFIQNKKIINVITGNEVKFNNVILRGIYIIL